MNANDPVQFLTDLRDDGTRLDYDDDDGFTRYRNRGRMLLGRIFGDDHRYVRVWSEISFSPGIFFAGADNDASLDDLGSQE